MNVRQVNKLPGRKTDVKGAEWLAQLGECGLLSPSFVPSAPIRDLRDLTRYRKRLVQSRAQEALRVQKLLEDAGMKLASVAADILGKSGRAILDALVGGERDPKMLAEMALGRMRVKVPALREALATARFCDHWSMVLRTWGVVEGPAKEAGTPRARASETWPAKAVGDESAVQAFRPLEWSC